jgi:acyl carrier protein
MHDVEERLTKCFSAVFPELSPDEIVNASSELTGDWDSMSAVTLLAVVQEEFGIDLEVDGMENFASFETILARVSEAIRSKAAAKSLAGDHATL